MKGGKEEITRFGAVRIWADEKKIRLEDPTIVGEDGRHSYLDVQAATGGGIGRRGKSVQTRSKQGRRQRRGGGGGGEGGREVGKGVGVFGVWGLGWVGGVGGGLRLPDCKPHARRLGCCAKPSRKDMGTTMGVGCGGDFREHA